MYRPSFFSGIKVNFEIFERNIQKSKTFAVFLSKACGNAVQDQLVDAVGSWGALAFEIGCSLWVVCRGAVVLSCAAYAGVQCSN